MAHSTNRLMVVGVWAALQVGLAGCFYDYGALGGAKSEPAVTTGTGGRVEASGGTPGTGGAASTGGWTATGGAGHGTGGAGTGGATPGTGGAGSSKRTDTGGQTATGGMGAGTGGAGGGTGGTRAGGAGGAGGGTAGASPGTGGAGTGGAAGGSGAQVEPVLWYKFDDESGDAKDSGSGPGTPRNGILMTFGTGGAVAFSTTKMIGTRAITFAGNQATGGGYVVVPPIVDLAPGAVTLSMWVYPTVDRDWVRIFDFGSSQNVYMFLTTGQDANNYVRFAITTGGTTAEQRITANRALQLNQWQHVTVVLNAGSPYTGSVYINGALAGSNTAMSLHASNLGVTTGNYLGRSTFPADWYYTGNIDDFRIYNRALSAAEVTALFNER